jgi:hypothetical protein
MNIYYQPGNDEGKSSACSFYHEFAYHEGGVLTVGLLSHSGEEKQPVIS